MKIVSTNPGKNYEVVGEVESATEADVKDAVEMARAAQPKWASISLQDRFTKIRSLEQSIKDRKEDIA